MDGLDLTVPAGSVFGFLGPNGSGKTTTIRMLMDLIDPTSGTAEVLGRPMPVGARAVLPEVGALIEGPALYGFLNGRDNLLRYDRADPTADPRTRRARVGTALERVGLAAASGKKAKAYSLGMKQRLGLAAALLRPRQLLVLDEPTNGLDPQGMRNPSPGAGAGGRGHHGVPLPPPPGRDRTGLHARGGDRPGRHRPGPGRRPRRERPASYAVTTPDPGDAARILKEHGLTGLSTDGDRLTADAPPAAVDLADLNAALVGGGVPGGCFGVERGSLEDAFVALTGRGIRCRRLRGRSLGGRRLARSHLQRARDAAPVTRSGAPGLLGRYEIAACVRRHRTYALLAVLAAVPVLIGIAVRIETGGGGGGGEGGPDGGAGPAFLAQVTNNGFFLVFAALAATLPVFLPMAVGVVAGDAIAGEASSGTLRYLLVAPAGRTRLLLVKYASVLVFCLMAPEPCRSWRCRRWRWARCCSRWGTSPRSRGPGSASGEGLVRAALTALVVAVSLAGFAAIGLLVSTLTGSGIGAMAAGSDC
ncbi:hypothetical protein SBADM41S_07217 [Streptomyces badius]